MVSNWDKYKDTLVTFIFRLDSKFIKISYRI